LSIPLRSWLLGLPDGMASVYPIAREVILLRTLSILKS
jgi:hypothetical protein